MKYEVMDNGSPEIRRRHYLPYLAAGSMAMLTKNAWDYGVAHRKSREMMNQIISQKKTNMPSTPKRKLKTPSPYKADLRWPQTPVWVKRKPRLGRGAAGAVPVVLQRTPKSEKSVAAGKFKRGKYKKHKRFSKGIVQNLERGGDLSWKYCGYIGHSTYCQAQIRKLMARLLVKELYRLHGFEINSFADIPHNDAGFAINIRYYLSNTTTTITSQLYNIASTDTYEIIAGQVGVWLATLAGTDAPHIIDMALYNSTYTPDLIMATLKVDSLLVEFYAKSSLKLQNVSTGTGGNEADDVDNIPLHGKSYETKGSGFNYRDIRRQGGTLGVTFSPFIADDQYGVINVNGEQEGGPVNSLREPPPAHVFATKVKVGKVLIQPGHIKTSVIKTRRVMMFNYMLRLLGEQYSSQTPMNRFGYSRMFALEKILENQVVYENIRPILVRFEHNIRMSLNARSLKRNITTQINEFA